MKNIISFAVGLIFALGLGLSGMTKPQVVRSFLDIFGEWDASLLGVMIGAIAVHATFYHLTKHRTSPLLDVKFHLPTRKDIDKKLITGAILFGLGWGWAGICPGPSLVGVWSGDFRVLLFIASMILGMFIFKKVEHKL
jgi:uncharacterized protein